MTVSAASDICPSRGPDRARGDLQRFPDWDVDLTNAKLSPTSTVRGWETMPAVLG